MNPRRDKIRQIVATDGTGTPCAASTVAIVCVPAGFDELFAAGHDLVLDPDRGARGMVMRSA
jgi:hypothetical protein